MEVWQIDAVWLSIAFGSGILARRLNLPPLIGFLLTGFIINATGLTKGNISEVLPSLADLGVVLLLFTIGLKIKIKTLVKPEIWASASLHILLSIILLGGMVFIFSFLGLNFFGHLSILSSALIGFALSFSSTVFVVKVLEEKGELNSLHGNIAIGILVIQDIFAVLFIALSANKAPSLWAFALIPLLYVIRKLLFKILDNLGHGELLTIFGFFATFTVGAFSFSMVGLKPDLGALIIGMLLVGHEKSDELYDRMMEFKDFFLIAFFINIGLTGQVTWNAIGIALLLLPFAFFKSGLFFYLLTRFNLTARTAFHTSVSMANYSEFGLIVGVVAMQMELINTEWLVALAILMSFSFLVSSPINNAAHELYDRIQPVLNKIKGPKACQDEEPIHLGDAEFLILGMGTIGRPAYRFLESKHSGKVLGIDYGQDRVDRLKKEGYNIMWGDSTDSQFWVNANFDAIKMVLFSISDQSSNVNSLKEMMKTNNKHFQIGAIANYPDQVEELKALGVDFVYCYKEKLGKEFAEDCLLQSLQPS
jgi:glutathione-regulated potassium-efflux system ancillary protein KefC